jgi:hypothetical protein
MVIVEASDGAGGDQILDERTRREKSRSTSVWKRSARGRRVEGQKGILREVSLESRR